MGDVERAVVGTGQHAGGERLVLVDFGQDSAGAAGGVEDLDSQFAGHVVATDFVDGHAVAFRDRHVWRWLVEVELAFRVDRKSHRHGRHLCVEDATRVDSERPSMSPAVIGDGQCAAVVRDRDAVGFGDAGIDRGDFVVFATSM